MRCQSNITSDYLCQVFSISDRIPGKYCSYYYETWYNSGMCIHTRWNNGDRFGTQYIIQYEVSKEPKVVIEQIQKANLQMAVGYTRENRQ